MGQGWCAGPFHFHADPFVIESPDMILRLGNRELALDRPRVMGVLNVTPDSFSDGGRFPSAGDAVDHAATMVDAGADIIDVGGESTRPGAVAVGVDTELDRVIPVIEQIVARHDVPVSVDTSKPAVMAAAVSVGATMINDVRALREPGALEAASALECAICLMHMQGSPADMQDNPVYGTLPGDVIRFLGERIDACTRAGIDRERLVVDPGFGFGKNDRHNLRILARLDECRELGRPILVGLSRKRTLGNLTGKGADGRVAAGIAAAVMAIARGANIIRTHDVGETADAVRVAVAVEKAGRDE
jgi:dihydropteroate synthase